MNAVVQGSNGAKEDVAEYMNTVCSEDDWGQIFLHRWNRKTPDPNTNNLVN